MYVDLDAVVGETTFDDIVKWAVRYEVSWCDSGTNSEVYTNETDAAERVATLRAKGCIGASYKILPTVAAEAAGKTDTSD